MAVRHWCFTWVQPVAYSFLVSVNFLFLKVVLPTKVSLKAYLEALWSSIRTPVVSVVSGSPTNSGFAIKPLFPALILRRRKV